MFKLIASNIVIVAQNLNPSIFSQLWLIRNQVFQEDEFKGDFYFSPAAVNVKGQAAELLVVPERLQLTVTQADNQDEVIKLILTKVVTALPHTPYKAVGFNFEWISEPVDKVKFPQVIREMFVSDRNPLARFFAAEDSRFGIYMSTDVGNMRLRLDVKPLPEEALRFSFNFHQGLDPENAVDMIVTMLDDWPTARDLSEKIVKEASQGWSLPE